MIRETINLTAAAREGELRRETLVICSESAIGFNRLKRADYQQASLTHQNPDSYAYKFFLSFSNSIYLET